MGTIITQSDFVEDTEYEPGIAINWGANAENAGTQHVVSVYTIIPPGSKNPAHYHENAEALAFVITGNARLVTGGEEFIVGPRTFCHTPPGEVHQWFNLSETEPVVICGIYGGVNRMENVGTVLLHD